MTSTALQFIDLSTLNLDESTVFAFIEDRPLKKKKSVHFGVSKILGPSTEYHPIDVRTAQFNLDVSKNNYLESVAAYSRDLFDGPSVHTQKLIENLEMRRREMSLANLQKLHADINQSRKLVANYAIALGFMA